MSVNAHRPRSSAVDTSTPANPDTEAAVLSTLLLYADDLPKAISTGLVPDHFTDSAYRCIADAIWELHEEGLPTDAVTVSDRLRKRGHLDDVGGMAKLSELQLMNEPRALLEHHARQVGADATRRRLVWLGADLAKFARKSDDAAVARIKAELAEVDVSETRTTLGSKLLTLAQLQHLPEPEWLVDGVLSLDSLAIMFGKRGAHKSFVAVDLLASAAVGARWHRRVVRAASGLYVVGEGASGLHKRFAAWRAAHPQHAPELAILPEPVNLLNAAQVAQFAATAVDVGAELIVFDTLARMLVGGDENSTKDAGIAVDHLDHLRRRTGACVLVVHHTGHGDTNRARGSSAFEAAADTVLEVATSDRVVTVSVTKQKNHAAGNPMRLQARPVADSLVLDDYDGSEVAVTESAMQTLQALAEVETEGGVSTSVWRVAANVPERSFYRHRKALVDGGLVENVGSDKRPLYQVVHPAAATLPATAIDLR